MPHASGFWYRYSRKGQCTQLHKFRIRNFFPLLLRYLQRGSDVINTPRIARVIVTVSNRKCQQITYGFGMYELYTQKTVNRSMRPTCTKVPNHKLYGVVRSTQKIENDVGFTYRPIYLSVSFLIDGRLQTMKDTLIH